MRVAFVSTIFSYPWGGADALWTAAAEHAVGRGDQVLIAIAASTADHPRIHALEKKGAKIVIRKPKPMSGGKLTLLRHLRWRASGGDTLQNIFAKWKPERVIVSQGGPTDYTQDLEALEGARQVNAPYEIICQSNSDLFSIPPKAFDRAREWARTARRFWFVSNQNLKLAEIQFAMPFPNARIIQNPIGISSNAPLPWPSSPPWNFAVVARLDAVCKGLDLLFATLPRVLGDAPDWSLSIYGRGGDEGYLRELAKYTGMENRIRFAGYAQDVQQIWHSHHMLLLPSRLEGCALAMLEAMAFGRPVLATGVGGAAEWIRPEVDGFLCPAPTVEHLSETLAHAWSLREKWLKMGQSAAERFTSLRDPAPGKTLIEDFS